MKVYAIMRRYGFSPKSVELITIVSKKELAEQICKSEKDTCYEIWDTEREDKYWGNKY